MIPDQKYHLPVRLRTTRKLINRENLYKSVEAEPIAISDTITLPTDSRKHQYKR
ncbi:hypothetical protein [uncultured Polaribacter sp.]|uniref:hypothetical protein n=1 Tax=uncultured Polaribacter sp. TaxID=174711 RepID=UPI00260777F8|nr:hypothetical protein [uncultured Polaribacter sp.]